MPECGELPEPVHRMSSPAPPPPSGRRKSVLGLTPRAWLYVAIAFAVGIGLFLLIWAKQRAEDDFYRADTSRQSATGQVFEPLRSEEHTSELQSLMRTSYSVFCL